MAKQKQQPLLGILGKGILRENPVLRLVLGMCPTLAVTTSVENGLGMGLAASFVLISSNLIISVLRNAIPAKVRIPAFITIIAGMVTLVQMLMQALLPTLNESLGIFIPLITVNCIILARAEMFASKNAVLPSVIDGLGMGLGYTGALVLMGTVREVLGNGSFFNLSLPGLQAGGYVEPMLVMILPPGGFFALGILVALAQKLNTFLDKRDRQPADSELNCAGAINDQTACLLCGGCSLGQRASQEPIDPETAEFNKRGNPS